MIPRVTIATANYSIPRNLPVDTDIHRQKAPSNVPFQGTIQHFPIKRIFDLIFSLTALIIFSPTILILMFLVKITSSGPIFFSHTRIGRGGKTFSCYKFRTMYKDAENRLEMLLKSNPKLCKEWNQTQKLKNDPRITPVGRILRQTSLDEFPQFWNVLKGDLSIVGPRPVVALEVQNFLGKQAKKILAIRPGLTCFWQVSERNNCTYDQRIALDVQYVNTHSLSLDLKLIALTIPAMFLGRGAY
jgi:undecaprenyl-phosphate galactose phosphotransferase